MNKRVCIARLRHLQAWACLLAGIMLGFSGPLLAQDDESHYGWKDWLTGGHVKYQFIGTRVPEDSVFYPYAGHHLREQNLESRLKFSRRKDAWQFDSHVQLIGAHADRLALAAELPELLFSSKLANDNRRWFNLSHEFYHQGKSAAVFRLDRLSIAYTGEKTVLRFGRQAISWGNGLLFTPMDIMNPFDPTAVDKEYKSGDDMLYAQYLFDDGSDLQAVAVVRRNLLNGEVESDASSLALKYHGFMSSLEYDVLASRHYADTVIGLGLSSALGDGLFYGDLSWTSTRHDDYLSAVAGGSWSGVLAGHNWQGHLEYYFNGFGVSGASASLEKVAAKPALLERLARGELYNTGRHYLGASVMVELTPLLLITPRVFVNLADPSALAQLVMAYDWQQDIQFLAALSLPLGADGTEYGGLESGQEDSFVSTGTSLFMQLAWYF